MEKSIYDSIKTAEELLKEVAAHGLSTKPEDICRAQDIFGRSEVKELIHQFNRGISPELMYQCRCTYCGANGPIKGTKRAAIRAWNRRDMSNGKNQTARNRC